MGSITQRDISDGARELVAAIGNQPLEESTAKDTGEGSDMGERADYDKFASCPEMGLLKDETKKTETPVLRAIFGSDMVLLIEQYALRHKTGYIKIEDEKLGCLYPIRDCLVYIRTSQHEKENALQWKEGVCYRLHGSLMFRPVDEPIGYIIFAFRKKE